MDLIIFTTREIEHLVDRQNNNRYLFSKENTEILDYKESLNSFREQYFENRIRYKDNWLKIYKVRDKNIFAHYCLSDILFNAEYTEDIGLEFIEALIKDIFNYFPQLYQAKIHLFIHDKDLRIEEPFDDYFSINPIKAEEFKNKFPNIEDFYLFDHVNSDIPDILTDMNEEDFDFNNLEKSIIDHAKGF